MLLSQDEILERVKLYTDLQNAIKQLAALDAVLPVECPPNFRVGWDHGQDSPPMLASAAVEIVCKGAWKSLRAAALASSKRTLDTCEARVRKFEAGEEVE